MSLISFVIPVFREARNIPRLVAALEAVTVETGDEHEIIFIDDGSPDDTWEVLQTQPVRALSLSRNFGKEAALAAGLAEAHGNAVVILDADFQHPPTLIPEMIRIWKSGAVDVVEAVKIDRGRESFLYRRFATAFYSIFRACCGFDLRGASDFKLLDARVVGAWREMREVNLFFRGMSNWVGYRRATIPFEVAPRLHGQSGWSLFGLVKLAVVGITAFTTGPLHLVTAMSGVFCIMAFLLGIRALIVKFQGQAIDGFTLLILLNLVMGSMILLGLGIIGEYLARMYVEIKGRPRYLVRESFDGQAAVRRADRAA